MVSLRRNFLFLKGFDSKEMMILDIEKHDSKVQKIYQMTLSHCIVEYQENIRNGSSTLNSIRISRKHTKQFLFLEFDPNTSALNSIQISRKQTKQFLCLEFDPNIKKTYETVPLP